MFFSPRCPKCKRLSPIWEKIADKYRDSVSRFFCYIWEHLNYRTIRLTSLPFTLPCHLNHDSDKTVPFVIDTFCSDTFCSDIFCSESFCSMVIAPFLLTLLKFIKFLIIIKCIITSKVNHACCIDLHCQLFWTCSIKRK